MPIFGRVQQKYFSASMRTRLGGNGIAAARFAHARLQTPARRTRLRRGADMKISFVRPRAELQPHIESFWVLDSLTGLPATAGSIAAPNGCSKLIIPCENSI